MKCVFLKLCCREGSFGNVSSVAIDLFVVFEHDVIYSQALSAGAEGGLSVLTLQDEINFNGIVVDHTVSYNYDTLMGLKQSLNCGFSCCVISKWKQSLIALAEVITNTLRKILFVNVIYCISTIKSIYLFKSYKMPYFFRKINFWNCLLRVCKVIFGVFTVNHILQHISFDHNANAPFNK